MTTISFKEFSKGGPVNKTPTQAPTPSSPQLSPIVEFGKGLVKGLGSTIRDVEDIGNTVANKVLPGYAEQPQEQKGLLLNKDLSASNNYQKVGKLTEGAAELAIPFVGEKALTATTDALGKTIKPTTELGGKILKKTGEALTSVGVSPGEGTKLALQTYEAKQPNLSGRIKNFVTNSEVGTKPITEANTAVRKGLAGTEWQLGVQAKKAGSSLWSDIIQPKLAEVKGKVDVKSFFNEVEKTIKEKTPELSRQNSLMEGLDALKNDYKGVKNISLEELQKFKEGWAKVIPDATYKGKPIGSALKDVKNLAAEKARSIIYKNIGEEGKQAYIDYGNLKSIEKAGIKSMDPLRSKGWTRQVWEAVVDKAVTPVTSFGGKVLYKTGEGLEFLGDKGAKTVGEVIGHPSKSSVPLKVMAGTNAITKAQKND